MTVRVTKPKFNLRDKISELDRPVGAKGSDLMKSDTIDEARNFLSSGRKNMIINGAMQINQRSTGSVQVTDAYTLDRWKLKETSGGVISINRDAFPVGDNHPAGFGHAMQLACATADTSLTGTEHATLFHHVEGYNTVGSGFGTNSAKDLTLSFWCKTNCAGTYSICLQNAAQNKSLIKEYQAGQNGYNWEKVSIKLNRCTDGTWDITTGIGFKLTWGFAGAQASYATGDLGTWKGSNLFLSNRQTNFFSSTNNRFFLTGVQLEIGTNPTDFEHRSYAEELALCYRYYRRFTPYSPTGTDNYCGYGVGLVNQAGGGLWTFPLDIPMRDRPSIAQNNLRIYDGSNNQNITAMNTNRSSNTSIWVEPYSSSQGFTTGRAFIIGGNNSAGGYVELDAEL